MRAAHVAEMRVMQADARVMATLGTPQNEDRFVAAMLDHWDAHGYGMWLFYEPAGGDFVGRANLRCYPLDGRDEIEVGYAVLSKYWGRGFGTEMAQALAGIAFGQMGAPSLIAFTLPDNTASRRVMEKLGMTYERDIVHAGLPHVLYRMSADGWRARTIHKD